MFDDLSAFDLVFIVGALAFGFGVVRFMLSVNNKPPAAPKPPDEPPSAPPAH